MPKPKTNARAAAPKSSKTAKKTPATTKRTPKTARMDPQSWLDAALLQAADTGWTADLPRLTAVRLGVDSALAVIVYPQGTRDIVAAMNEMADEAMVAAIHRHAGYRYLKIRQKIAFAVRARLEALEAYRPALRQLPDWAMRPSRGLQTLRSIWATADMAWYEAGDTATDYNHYTKRLLLSAVIVATKLFWLRDESRGSAASWAYLDARIDDVLQLGQKIGGLKQLWGMAEKVMRARGGR